MVVRTRFAPSPTGYMHIGNLRTALYAYCIAKHSQGTFILRIEDTDRKRNVPKAIQVIYDSLRLAGLEYDEGPCKDGDYGPYVQSQRKDQGIYQRQADRLVEGGAAYPCFCGKSVDGKGNPAAALGGAGSRGAAARRNVCRYLTPAEVQAHLDAGDPYVIRQRIPDEGVTTFHDLVYGDISVKNSLLDEQVLLKSDGFPTYNFANVVDDHLMAITHVARGVEYLSSTPKYNLLYEAFGWEAPVYIHLPHIVKEGGKKLSKRAGDASFQDLLAQGFLPEAIVNYIALLGWSPGNDQEYFDLASLVELFDPRHINKSKAAFALPKLEWLNGEHIRQIQLEKFHAYASQYYPPALKAACDTQVVSRMIQTRLTRLTNIPEMTRFLLAVEPYDLALYQHAKSNSTLESSRLVLKAALPALSALAQLQPWSEDAIRQALLDLAAELNMKTGTLLWPVRVALSGRLVTPGGAIEIAAALGLAETLRRIEAAIACLS